MNIILLSNMKSITRSLCGIFVVCSLLFITGSFQFVASAGNEGRCMDVAAWEDIAKVVTPPEGEPVGFQVIPGEIIELAGQIRDVNYFDEPELFFKVVKEIASLEVQFGDSAQPGDKIGEVTIQTDELETYREKAQDLSAFIDTVITISEDNHEKTVTMLIEPAEIEGAINKVLDKQDKVMFATLEAFLTTVQPLQLEPVQQVLTLPQLEAVQQVFTLLHFTLSLDAGINLISVPLNPGEPWTLRDLADYIGKENVEMIIYLKDNKLIGYTPDSPEDTSADVPVTGDEAYIVVMKSPVNVTFMGKAWDVEISLSKGLDTMSLPVNPGPWMLSDLASYIGPNLSSIIWYDRTVKQFMKYNPAVPETGDTIIRGGQGYFVSMTEPVDLTFEGEAWMNTPDAVASPPAIVARKLTATPLLIIEGTVLRKDTGQKLNDIEVTVRNSNTGSIVTADTDSRASSGRYIAILADLIGNRTARVGDILEMTVQDSTGALETEQIRYIVTLKDVQAGKISLGEFLLSPIPKKSVLLANYPNPFNPETWIPFRLSGVADVTIRIYNVKGKLVRTLILGSKAAGTYVNREKAAYWDGKNDNGEKVASGVYFYSIKAGKFSATRRMVLVK